MITKLTETWKAEQRSFAARDLSGVDYVYLWADGIHVNIRLEEHKLCLLVLIGVRADGRKELVALADGYRESTESWADLLRDCARRGMRAPVLAVGDGALGFWGALREVFPQTREQRCWFHKIANVLGALPEVGASRGEEGAGRDLERRGPPPRPRRREGVRGRLRGEVRQGGREDHRRPRASCWRSTTSPPSTGSTCGPRMKSSTPSLAARLLPGIHFLARPPRQPEIAGPEPGSRWSARSAARTNDLDPGEDRRSVRRRWTWSDPVAKCRVWGCQPCRAALPREGLESRAPVVAATSTPDLPAPALRVAAAAVLPVGRVGCQAATVTR